MTLKDLIVEMERQFDTVEGTNGDALWAVLEQLSERLLRDDVVVPDDAILALSNTGRRGVLLAFLAASGECMQAERRRMMRRN